MIETLPSVAKEVGEALDAILVQRIAIMDMPPRNPQITTQHERAHDALQRASQALSAAGYPALAEGAAAPEFDLGMLRSLDSPAARALLTGLEELQVIAAQLDAERSQDLYVDVLEDITARLRREIHGAMGKGLE